MRKQYKMSIDDLQKLPAKLTVRRMWLEVLQDANYTIGNNLNGDLTISIVSYGNGKVAGHFRQWVYNKTDDMYHAIGEL